MKISIKKSLFLEKITIATRFTSHKIGTPQALQGIYIKCEREKMDIYSTNLSYYYHTSLPINTTGTASILIEPKKLSEFLNLLEQEELSIDIEEKQIVVIQGKTRGAFSLFQASDFPLPPKIDQKESKVEAELFKKNLPLVLFSSSKDDSRPVLSGVNFIKSDEGLLVVSTDRFRLSLLRLDSKEPIKNMLIPAEFLYEVSHYVQGEMAVGFTFSEEEKIILFSVGENQFYSRLIDGEFPPFEKVIPTEARTTVDVEAQELLRSIKLIAVFARDQSNIIMCNFKKDGLWISPKLTTGNENSTQIDIDINGEEQRVAFNYKFLLDFLNIIKEEKIRIEILRPDAPVVFKIIKNEAFTHIIMPVRIQE